jgi:transposase
MRPKRQVHTKLEVCRAYKRLKRRWQSLVDGTAAPSDSQPLDENAAMSARQKMVEHRENCEVCRKEDLALREGEVPRPVFAEIS